MKMKDIKSCIEERCQVIGQYMVDTKCTIRKASEHFGISKSCVHLDVSKRLKKVNPILAKQAREVLDWNASMKHIRGGNALRNKYRERKEINGKESN